MLFSFSFFVSFLVFCFLFFLNTQTSCIMRLDANRSQPSVHHQVLIQGQGQGQQGARDLPFSGHISQFWPGVPKRFLGQFGDISSPLGPGSALRPSPSWPCLEHLPRTATRTHPCLMHEPPEPAPFNAKGAAAPLKSSFKDYWTHHIPERDVSHPPEKTHFSCAGTFK